MELAVAAVITGILIAILRTPVRYQDFRGTPPDETDDPASEARDPQV
jgi:hypothetical protein